MDPNGRLRSAKEKRTLSMTAEEQFHELSFYTLSHTGPDFIHQSIVDAFTAQMANETTKPIAICFALAGLYLSIEKNYTGRQVQLAHMKMAKRSERLISIDLPAFRGDITIAEVLIAAAGHKRDEMIARWCRSVWDAFADQQKKVISLTEDLLRI